MLLEFPTQSTKQRQRLFDRHLEYPRCTATDMQPQQPNGQPAPVPIQNHAHVATDSTGSTNAVWTTSTDDGSEILVAQNSGNGPATTGLVMGILAITTFLLGFIPFLCFFFMISWLFALLAVIFGHIGASLEHHKEARKQDRCWWRARCGWLDPRIPDTCWLSSPIPSAWIDWSRCIDLEPHRDV